MTGLRPLRRCLSDEAVALMTEQRANGLTPLPIHLMMVDDNTGRGKTLCDGGLGEWVTGDVKQVTCSPCLKWAHA